MYVGPAGDDNRGELDMQADDEGDPRINGNEDVDCFIYLCKPDGSMNLLLDQPQYGDVLDLMSCSVEKPQMNQVFQDTGYTEKYYEYSEALTYSWSYAAGQAPETLTLYLCYQGSTYAGDNYIFHASVRGTNAGCEESDPHDAFSPTVTMWRKYYVKLDGMQKNQQASPTDLFYDTDLYLPDSVEENLEDIFRGAFIRIEPSPIYGTSQELLQYHSPILKTAYDLNLSAHGGSQWVAHENLPDSAKNATHQFACDEIENHYPGIEFVTGLAMPPDMENHPHCTGSIGAYRWLWANGPVIHDETYWEHYLQDFLDTSCHEAGHIIGHFPDHRNDQGQREKSIMHYKREFKSQCFNNGEYLKLRRGRDRRELESARWLVFSYIH